MKKIMMFFMSLFLMISLSSCGGKQTVTIIDDNGMEKEVVIENSEDPEVIYNALTYAANPKFDDVKGISLKSSLNFKLRTNDENDFSIGYEGQIELDTEEKIYASLFINQKGKMEGIESSLKLSTDLYKDNDSAIYLDYELKEDENQSSKKIKITEDTIKSLIELIIGNIELPTTLAATNMPDTNYVEEFKLAYNEFKEKFVNSSLKVDGVGSNSMTIKMNLSLKDIIRVVNEENNLNITMPTGDAFIKISYKLDSKNARPLALNLVIGGNDFTKALKEITNDNSTIDNPSISLELKLEANYSNKSKVKTLSAKDKEAYKDLALPTFPF